MTNQVEVSIVSAEEVVTEIVGSDVTSIVEVNSPALRQPVAQVRIDADSVSEIYTGLAQYGIEESAPLWSITKATFDANGSRLTKNTITNVTWTGRAGHTYT